MRPGKIAWGLYAAGVLFGALAALSAGEVTAALVVICVGLIISAFVMMIQAVDPPGSPWPPPRPPGSGHQPRG